MLRKSILLFGFLTSAAILPFVGQSGSAGSKAATKTLTGTISDSMCGAQHMAKDKSAAECTRLCVKQGSDYALVVGQKVYTLKGNASELDKYAGDRVTVKGTQSGSTINADSITPAKGNKKS
jgi:hypothetical protein